MSAFFVEAPEHGGPRNDQCVVCGGSDVRMVVQTPPLPVDANRLFSTAEEARLAALSPIRLSACRTCGHLFNAGYVEDVVDYTADYENSLSFSPRFNSYARALAAELVERYELYGRPIVEIGGGRGDFLGDLLDAGAASGTSVDPGFRADVPAVREGIRGIPEYYSRAWAGLPASLIACRHVLEHVADPVALVSAVREAVDRTGSELYFEVPNGDAMVDDGAAWELTYTHVSYFTRSSLSALFTRCGFPSHCVQERFRGQFLSISTGPPDPNPSCRRTKLESFGETTYEKIGFWRKRLRAYAAEGRRIVLWGAGARAVTFLNAVGAEECIHDVIDVSPRKAGSYLASAGYRIVATGDVAVHPPDVVVAVNPIYREEIGAMLAHLAPRAELLVAA